MGYGLPPDAASLGELLLQGKNNLDAPWLALSGFFSLAFVLSLLIYIGRLHAMYLTQENNLSEDATLLK